jgi:uncharacterized protein (TIGR03067 family)
MSFIFRNLFSLAAACIALAAGTSSVRADDQPAKAPKDLQGMWKLVSVESEGMLNDPPGGKPKWVIKGNKVVYGGSEIAELKIDDSTAPKIVDFKLRDPDRVYEGIYSVEKGTLKICVNRLTEGAKDRPGTFSTKDQSDWRLLVFEQEKDAKADASEGLSGFVGLQLKAGEDNNEVLVVTPLKDSPADKAGFKKDDVILKVAGAAVADLQGTINTVRKAKPGDRIEFRIRREKEESTITVKVGVLPFQYVAGLG